MGELVSLGRVRLIPRAEAERDGKFKQVCSYVVLTCGTRAWSYRRAPSGTEGGLVGLRSLGVGGHVTAADLGGKGGVGATGLHRAIGRELAEEVRLNSLVSRSKFLGLINTNEGVGKKHIGIVYCVSLFYPDVEPAEPHLADPVWLDRSDLVGCRDKLEPWSQLLLGKLISKKILD